LEPMTVTLCPAEPLEGLNDEMTGGPPGATATVVVVEPEAEAGVVVEDEPLVPCFPPRGLVDGRRFGVVVACTARAAVEDGGPGLESSETRSATDPATTSAARTAAERISQRSCPARDGLSAQGGVSAVGRASANGAGGGPPGRSEICSPGSGEGGRGASPADSRARRTALSIAPRARWPGVPGGGSAACWSAIGSSDA
jgi:hypothetical protein